MKKNDQKVTIETLATMVASGFSDVGGEVKGMRSEIGEIKSTMATKKELAELKHDLEEAMSRVIRQFS